MCVRTLLAVCPLLAAASLTFANPASTTYPVGDEDMLHWRKERYALDHIPSEIPEATRAAIARFGPWASEHDYHLYLNAEADVLLLTRGSKRPKRELRLVDKADRYLDELLAARSDDVRSPSETEADPLVLVQARSQEDYSTLVDHVVALESYLASWSRSGKRDAGFVLEKPLCAAWMEDPPGVEEWSPDNELLHRMARLRLLSSFGQLPNWVALGVAWAAEDTIGRGIYCFPYRDSFVGVGEHSGWDKILKRLSKKAENVDFSRISRWQRGTWDQNAAQYAFGVVRFFERAHPGTLSAFLDELKGIYEEKRIERFADGSWKIRTGYEVSHEDQSALLEETFGDGIYGEMASFFKKGMPRAKKKRR